MHDETDSHHQTAGKLEAEPSFAVASPTARARRCFEWPLLTSIAILWVWCTLSLLGYEEVVPVWLLRIAAVGWCVFSVLYFSERATAFLARRIAWWDSRSDCA